LNYHQMGVGGDNAWGARPHPEYTLDSDQSYHYRYRLQPITKQDDPMKQSKRVVTTDLVEDIQVDGESLTDFTATKTEYTMNYLKGTVKDVPDVDVKTTRDDVDVEVEKADKVPGKTIVKVASADGS